MRSTLKSLSAARRTYLTILVAALGYFVDVFDIQLFGIVRVRSLHDLGLNPDAIMISGAHLLNWQMAGMLLGGLLWGVLGDKKGRVYVLFGTILLYSLGNIANAFVTTIPAYAAARFFTGLGLAGEIGAGITLASELLPKETRGYGTFLIAIFGTMGPVAGSFIANALDWRWAYAAGGVMGLMLLLLRVTVAESGLFAKLNRKPGTRRGHLPDLFNNRRRLTNYVSCILLAVPIWFIISIIVVFSPELGIDLGANEPLKAAISMMSFFVGQTLGGISSGLISQLMRNRRKVTAVCIVGAAVMTYILLHARGISSSGFYALLMLDGFFCGYWGLFLTITAECFGTNLRTTATATVSNFVRGSVIIETIAVTALKPHLGLTEAVGIVAVGCFCLALLAIWRLPETFSKDLDFLEH